MKLTTKIFGGFLFLLFLTAAMAYLGWHNLRVLIAEMEQGYTLNLIMKNALEARHQEKNYVNRGGQEYLDQVSRSFQAIKDLTAAGRRAMPDQASQASFDRTLEVLGLYETAFNRYVSRRQEDKQNSPDQKRLLEQADKDMVTEGQALLKEVEAALSSQKTGMQSQVATAGALIGLSAVFAILVGLLVSLLLVKSLTRTLKGIISGLGGFGASGRGFPPSVQRQQLAGRRFFPAGGFPGGDHRLPGTIGGPGATELHERRGMQPVGAPNS